jgi:hypothetical protein
MFSSRPELLVVEANHQYAQCCKSDIVGENYAVCGKNFTVGPIEEIQVRLRFLNTDTFSSLNVITLKFALTFGSPI